MPLAVLTSDYYTNKKPNKAFRTLITLGEHAGLIIIPTIQKYMVNNSDFGYTDEDFEQNKRFIVRTMINLRNRGHAGLIVFPEGHRSETGALAPKVEDGMIDIGKILERTLYVPVGVAYENGERNGLNIGRLTHVTVGETYFQDGRCNAPDLAALMYNLADALPADMHGIWERPMMAVNE